MPQAARTRDAARSIARAQEPLYRSHGARPQGHGSRVSLFPARTQPCARNYAPHGTRTRSCSNSSRPWRERTPARCRQNFRRSQDSAKPTWRGISRFRAHVPGRRTRLLDSPRKMTRTTKDCKLSHYIPVKYAQDAAKLWRYAKHRAHGPAAAGNSEIRQAWREAVRPCHGNPAWIRDGPSHPEMPC